jgi:trehalose 6-phosphate synthase
VSALRGLKAADYVWLGWPGVAVNEGDREIVDTALAKENAAAIYLDEGLAKDHYNEFSSKWASIA